MTSRSIVESSLHAGDLVLLATQPDQRLIALARSGNERAFEVIVRRYRRPLLAYCRRLLPSDSAEDAVQQAFLNAYVAMKRSQSELRLRPWLQQIAHNASLDVLRRKALPREGDAADLAGGNGSDEMSERRQELGALLAAVDSLPDRQRAAILLRELNGLSYAEIAEELGVGVGAVRQLLSRARHGVRDGVGAMVPPALLLRLPAGSSGPDLGARVAEMCGGAAGAGALAKAVATVAAVGAIAGGLGQPSQGPGAESARADREFAGGGEASARRAPASEAPGVGRSGAAVAAPRSETHEPAGTGAEGVVDRRGPETDARDPRGAGGGPPGSGDGPTSSGPGSGADDGGGPGIAEDVGPGAGSPAADDDSFGDDDAGYGAGSPAAAAAADDGDDGGGPELDEAAGPGDDDDADGSEGGEGVGGSDDDSDRERDEDDD